MSGWTPGKGTESGASLDSERMIAMARFAELAFEPGVVVGWPSPTITRETTGDPNVTAEISHRFLIHVRIPAPLSRLRVFEPVGPEDLERAGSRLLELYEAIRKGPQK